MTLSNRIVFYVDVRSGNFLEIPLSQWKFQTFLVMTPSIVNSNMKKSGKG